MQQDIIILILNVTLEYFCDFYIYDKQHEQYFRYYLLIFNYFPSNLWVTNLKVF